MNEKVYKMVIGGKSDSNINYADFQKLITDLGFEFKRQRGSHAMYYHHGAKEFLNVQRQGSKAKDYQVTQLRDIIVKHGL